MKYCVVNLGCKVNRVESDSFERLLRDAGYEVSTEEHADLIVVNTCTVTGEAEKKTRKAVRHALRANDFAQVVVTGCAAAINADVFIEMSERVNVVPKSIMEEFLKDYGMRTKALATGTADVYSTTYSDNHFSSRTRVGVKVQDGCNNACTYCIVHVARGKATSRNMEEVIEECVLLAWSGVREIVLSGINIGSYNWNGIKLAGLLQKLLDATKDIHTAGEYPVRFRVSSIEPMDVDFDFIQLLAQAEGRVCRHLHLPLQSGSSKVLSEMCRPYSAQEFKNLVDNLYAYVPSLALTTDIIVGFPGETDDEFNETCDVARYCKFTKIHVFPYSMREGTPAAERADQISSEIKSQRAATLRALSKELREIDRFKRRCTTELALVEESGKAMTESYYELTAPHDAEIGSLIQVCLR